MSAVVIALLAAAGACLAMPPRPSPRLGGLGQQKVPRPPAHDVGWMRRWRWPLSALAGVGVLLVLGGSLGAVLAPVGATACWLGIGRIEPPGARREREQLARELPHLVQLLGAALVSGAAPETALEAVTEALTGVASVRLGSAAARLRLGADPAEVWSELARSPSLAPLGRTLARAHSSGAPVAVAVGRLADELARTARAEVESRARAVGVKAALPLGLCLLPSFLLIGIVPLAAGLLSTINW